MKLFCRGIIISQPLPSLTLQSSMIGLGTQKLSFMQSIRKRKSWLSLAHSNSENELAHIMTKAVTKNIFEYLMKKLAFLRINFETSCIHILWEIL